MFVRACATIILACCIAAPAAIAAPPKLALTPLQMWPSALNNEPRVLGSDSGDGKRSRTWSPVGYSAFATNVYNPQLLANDGGMFGLATDDGVVASSTYRLVRLDGTKVDYAGLKYVPTAFGPSNELVGQSSDAARNITTVWSNSKALTTFPGFAPYLYGARDGGVVLATRPAGAAPTGPTDPQVYLAPGSTTQVPLPNGNQYQPLGASAFLVTHADRTFAIGRLAGTRLVETRLTLPPVAGLTSLSVNAAIAGAVVANARGEVVKRVNRGEVAAVAPADQRRFHSLWRYTPASGWNDISKTAIGATSYVPTPLQVNDYGDLLVGYSRENANALVAADDPPGADGGALLRVTRLLVTGSIASATGGSLTKGAITGKRVAITAPGASAPVYATLTAKGTFTAALPMGTGYRFTASKGLCVRTLSGCFSTGIVNVARATTLTTTTGAGGGAYPTSRRGAQLVPVRRIVRLGVRCTATTLCTTTLTLRAGRSILATGAVRLTAGRSGVVTLKLTTAGSAALAKQARLPVTAVLAATAAGSNSTATQTYVLARG